MTKTQRLIPLNQAPDHFFDQEKWQQFVTLSKSRGGALNGLTNPGYRIRNFDIDDSQSETSRIIRLRDELLDEFTRKLIGGEIIAKGILFPSTKPSEIPAAIWEQNITFNFDSNRAISGKYEFIGVHFYQAKIVVATITKWLLAYTREYGVISKTVLLSKAQGKLGNHIKEKDFNTAYKKAFNKPRGRPRKPALEK